MTTKLTPRLLGFLIKRGYKFFLSQTSSINQDDANIGISLKPVKKHPLLQKLPQPFQTYYNIIQEPVQMAFGVFNTLITVELSRKEKEKYDNSLISI